MRAALFVVVGLALALPAPAAPVKGKALTPELAPIFSPAVENSSVLLQPARSIKLDAPATGPGAPVINCRLKVNQIGPVNFPDAEVVIVNNSVEVRPGLTALDREPLLRGRVLKVDREGTAYGAGREMSGLVLFQSGDRIWQLNEQDAEHPELAAQPPAGELVFRRSGSIAGQIVAVKVDSLTVQRGNSVTTIPLDSVVYVRSPRAYLFTISGRPSADMTRTQVDGITFRPTTSTASLNDELIVGKPKDPLDDDDDLPLRTPDRINRIRQLDNNSLGPVPGRPFPSWP